MSNHLSIAAATATLSQVLDRAVGKDVNGAKATALRPNASSGLPETGINVYLYQVTPNVALRNADVPSRGPDGTLMQRPQAALDLYYLLSCYGKENQLEPQRVLGSAIRVLHERPILQRTTIREAIEANDFLTGSDLDEAIESIKLTQLPLSLEELAKLWSVFFQTTYVLSVAFQASVVLIDGTGTPRTTLPVRERNLYVVALRQPSIGQVVSAAGAQQPILAGATVRISGTRLRGDLTRVRIGETLSTPLPTQISDTQIDLKLPAGLRAGVQSLQVEHVQAMGTPPTPHGGIESNAVPFVLQPTVEPSVSGVSTVTVAGLSLRSATLTAAIDPPVGRTQRVQLALYEFDAPPDRPAHAYSFDAPPNNGIADPHQTETARVEFAVQPVFPGTYLVRVQVDGAQSPLGRAADGQFNTPVATLP